MKALLFAAPLVAAICIAVGSVSDSQAATDRNSIKDLTALPKSESPGERGLAATYATLAKERATRIADLEAYAKAGNFSINTAYPDRLVPVFVDENDTPCAVAHLMQKAGREALVAKVRETNNYVRIWDIKDGPVTDWILSSGLTREECELIQEPGFEPEAPEEPSVLRKRGDLPGTPLDGMDKATAMKQEHFFLVVRKLRADTWSSLRVALSRITSESESRGFQVFGRQSGAACALFTNNTERSLEIRAAALNADGSIKELDAWRMLEPGEIVSLAKCGKECPVLLEYREKVEN